ncbi:MAG: MFS transporter [Acidobacteria bacterium]|nr:MFS transporter [Acidobacteriota bacterium]
MPRILPAGPAAVLKTLRFDCTDRTCIATLTDKDWREAISYCDRNRITLRWFSAIQDENLPAWVRERFTVSANANRERLNRLLDLSAEVLKQFAAAGVECLILKGPAQWPDFVAELSCRTQYDLDLFCPADSLAGAVSTLRGLGYEALEEMKEFPTDHLPVMIRKTGWEWKGDFFDIEIPIAIEIHFQFWDRKTERFGPESSTEFWDGRVLREIGGTSMPVLGRLAALDYTCRHALRHLLRGDSCPVHLYEAAWFLHHSWDRSFEEQWGAARDEASIEIQGICFLLAQMWFGCRVPPQAQAAVDGLPASVKTWAARWGRSPLESPFHPNKDELWLHLGLLKSSAAKLAVLRRRLLPMRPPGPVGAVHVPAAQRTWRRRAHDRWLYLRFVFARFSLHARVLIPTLWSGLGWWFGRREISSAYWRFYGASMFFHFALFTFYLLYNLYLAEAGYREDFLGLIGSAMAAGSLAGSFSANALIGKIGLRRSLIACFAVTGFILALRLLLLGKTWLLALAFTGGMCQSLWAVCLSPSIAQLTTERNRSFVFSLFFSSSITLGIIAGAVDGWLPTVFGSIRNAIWFGCAFAPLAALPLLRIPLESRVEARQFFRPSPFLLRFLAAMAVWGVATGSLEPFFNVYFAKVVHMTTAQVGLVFSLARFAQVVAMLLAPLALRRFELVPGIALMQAGTAICLATLGVAPAVMLGGVYCAFTAFQYMSEPGIFSLLMKGVPEEGRTSASAWNFVVMFATHAIAAALAGQVIARMGYQPMLLAAAVLTALAAFLFFSLLREQSAP